MIRKGLKAGAAIIRTVLVVDFALYLLFVLCILLLTSAANAECEGYPRSSAYHFVHCTGKHEGAICFLTCDVSYNGTASTVKCLADGGWTRTEGCHSMCLVYCMELC